MNRDKATLLKYLDISENEIRTKFPCIIKISAEEYQKMVTYISDSFHRDTYKNVQWISGNSYGNRDAFYEANGSYNLFYTCNTWANNALKIANQKASLWTVTDTGILCHYQ